MMVLLVPVITAQAQNGTYEKKNAKGAYCTISFQKSGNHVKAEIFAWWNSFNTQTGYYNGTGVLKNGICVLQSDENEPGCKVTLTIAQGKIKALFNNCETDHLIADFNGDYAKITDAVAGNYIAIVPRAYFHKKPDASAKLKAYVLKGDKVTLDMQNITAGNWVQVYFTNKNGKETRGFILLSELEKAD